MAKQSRFQIELFLTATLRIFWGGKCGSRDSERDYQKNFNLSVGEIEDWKVHVDPKMLDDEYAAEGTRALTILESSTDYLFGIDLFQLWLLLGGSRDLGAGVDFVSGVQAAVNDTLHAVRGFDFPFPGLTAPADDVSANWD